MSKKKPKRSMTPKSTPAPAAAPAPVPPRRLRRVPPLTQLLLDDIEDLTLKHVDIAGTGGRRPQMRVTLENAGQAVAIARSSTVRMSAIPSSTPANGSPGGGSGGGGTSSTESVALGRLENRAPMYRQDPVLSIGKDIEKELHTLRSSLQRLGALNDRFDRIRSTNEVKDAPQCWVASSLYEFPWDEQWRPFTITKFEGVLEEPWPFEHQVCRWVYDFTRRRKRLPTHEEMQRYLERGVVAS